MALAPENVMQLPVEVNDGVEVGMLVPNGADLMMLPGVNMLDVDAMGSNIVPRLSLQVTDTD